jgi:hypothetical protein
MGKNVPLCGNLFYVIYNSSCWQKTVYLAGVEACRRGITLSESQSVCPFVRIGPPRPPLASECVPPSLEPRGGATLACG